jgi:hypothetical protein
MTSAVLQRGDKFRCESGKDLDQLLRSFFLAWRVVKNGPGALVESGEQLPDRDGTLQENQNVHISGTREFGDEMLKRPSV